MQSAQGMSGGLQVEAGIVLQMRLREAELYPLSGIDHERQEAVAAAVEARDGSRRVDILKGVEELALGLGSIKALHVGHGALAVARQTVFHAFALHLEGLLLAGNKAIGHAVVIGTEFHGIASTEVERERVAMVLHRGLACQWRGHLLLDGARLAPSETGGDTPLGAASERHTQCRGRQHLASVHLDVIGERRSHLDLRLYLPVGGGEGKCLLRHGCACDETQEAG